MKSFICLEKDGRAIGTFHPRLKLPSSIRVVRSCWKRVFSSKKKPGNGFGVWACKEGENSHDVTQNVKRKVFFQIFYEFFLCDKTKNIFCFNWIKTNLESRQQHLPLSRTCLISDSIHATSNWIEISRSQIDRQQSFGRWSRTKHVSKMKSCKLIFSLYLSFPLICDFHCVDFFIFRFFYNMTTKFAQRYQFRSLSSKYLYSKVNPSFLRWPHFS